MLKVKKIRKNTFYSSTMCKATKILNETYENISRTKKERAEVKKLSYRYDPCPTCSVAPTVLSLSPKVLYSATDV